MFFDELAEEGDVGEVEAGRDLLDGLVAVEQLLADGGNGSLMDEVERCTARHVLDTFREVLWCDVQHIGKS